MADITHLVVADGSFSASGAIAWDAAHVLTGPVTVAQGGTGEVTAPAALVSLGAYPASNPDGFTANAGTVTSVSAAAVATTGTDVSLSVGTGTTAAVITLSVPTASALNRGAVSAADWTGFNAKQAALVSGTNIKTVNSTTLLGSGDLAVGTVTSVGGTGTVNGLTLAGTVTGSGNLTLGGTLSGVSLTAAVTGTLPVANGGTGITSLGSGVATWLGTPSSANLAAAVTDETGSGALVFATSPTFVTPALGTPASGTLTNCTGLPVSSGISGLGTGVATFLATPSSANLASAVTGETGSGALVFATSPTLVTPALGTPTALVLTSATGLPLTTGVTGTLPVANGGAGTYVSLSADVTNNNATANTLADVTGMSFSVTSGVRYYFYFYARYTSAAGTTGSRWTVNGPATTELTYDSVSDLTATTRSFNAGLSAYSLPAAASATSAGTTGGNIAEVFGWIKPSADGTLQLRFASEVSSSAIVAKVGTWGTLVTVT